MAASREENVWIDWISDNWPALARGKKVRVGARLPHPSFDGFERLDFAEPHGQAADWALALDDGSRIHVHECPDGRLIAHRDRWDPHRSPVHAVMHIATETRAGKAAGVLGGVAGALFVVGKLTGR